MSEPTWFMRQRQDFIRAQLSTYGMIRRADIATRFEVTIQVASADIQAFIAAHPDAIDYDRTAKCYTYDSRAAIAPYKPDLKRNLEGVARPILSPAEYDRLRDDDKFLYNRGAEKDY